jgi:hypothetical protein
MAAHVFGDRDGNSGRYREHALASIVLIVSLVLFRMALELVYRLAFGDAGALTFTGSLPAKVAFLFR